MYFTKCCYKQKFTILNVTDPMFKSRVRIQVRAILKKTLNTRVEDLVRRIQSFLPPRIRFWIRYSITANPKYTYGRLIA